jgi:hypothetical protein
MDAELDARNDCATGADPWCASRFDGGRNLLGGNGNVSVRRTDMSNGKKIGIGLAVMVVFGGAWVGIKSFTGNPLGASCYRDDDCMGMESVCVAGAGNEMYCTVPCAAATDCPASFACGTVEITNISGTGEMTAGGSQQLCLRSGG